jgi:tetratricopeptide (TPR) repeat protein
MHAYEEALANYEFALAALDWESGTREKHEREIRILSRIGDSWGALGCHDRALEYHVRALRLGEQLGDSTRMAETLLRMGESYLELGEWSMGLSEFLRALSKAPETGRTHKLALIHIACAYNRIGAYPNAIRYMERLKNQELSEPELMRRAASAYLDSGAHVLEGSRELLERAQSLFKKLDDGDGVAACRSELRKVTRP